MPLTDLWQIGTEAWQPAFIRENLLLLGHRAWQGYLTQGRGLVVCEVAGEDITALDWRRDVVGYRIEYRPVATIRPYLTSYGLPGAVVDRLLAVAHTYTPEQEILLALRSGGSIELDWLRHMAIAPPDGYRQVCDRWDEFNLAPEPTRRCPDDIP